MLGRLGKEQKKHLVRHGGRHTLANLAVVAEVETAAEERNPARIGTILIPLLALAHTQMTTYISQCLFLITRLLKRGIGLDICPEVSRGLT